ncbi:MAG: hypothetical protein V3V14_12105 [Saprospiraceae bacterium]
MKYIIYIGLLTILFCSSSELLGQQNGKRGYVGIINIGPAIPLGMLSDLPGLQSIGLNTNVVDCGFALTDRLGLSLNLFGSLFSFDPPLDQIFEPLSIVGITIGPYYRILDTEKFAFDLRALAGTSRTSTELVSGSKIEEYALAYSGGFVM